MHLRSSLLILALVLLLQPAAMALDPPEGVQIPGTDARLYPIGWSRDGKLAYAIVDEPPLRAGYGFYFAIIDAKTDEILSWQYDHSDQFASLRETPPLVIAWQRHADTVAALMAEHGIEPVNSATVEAFPLRRGSDVYQVGIAEWRVDPKTSPYENGVVGYTLSFHSRERGSKIIARRSRIFATDISALGYVRSPFENRVVVLVAESGNAYGPSRFTDFTVVGAHLDVGFE